MLHVFYATCPVSHLYGTQHPYEHLLPLLDLLSSCIFVSLQVCLWHVVPQWQYVYVVMCVAYMCGVYGVCVVYGYMMAVYVICTWSIWCECMVCMLYILYMVRVMYVFIMEACFVYTMSLVCLEYVGYMAFRLHVVYVVDVSIIMVCGIYVICRYV